MPHIYLSPLPCRPRQPYPTRLSESQHSVSDPSLFQGQINISAILFECEVSEGLAVLCIRLAHWFLSKHRDCVFWGVGGVSVAAQASAPVCHCVCVCVLCPGHREFIKTKCLRSHNKHSQSRHKYTLVSIKSTVSNRSFLFFKAFN